MASGQLGSGEAMSMADVEPSSALNFTRPLLLNHIANETELDVHREQTSCTCLARVRALC